MIERQMKVFVETLLRSMPVIAIFLDRFPFLQSCEFRRRAVLVGAAQEQRLVADLAVVAGVDVSGQKRARQVAEVLDPVDIGKRGSDQDTGHGGAYRRYPHVSPTREFPTGVATVAGFAA